MTDTAYNALRFTSVYLDSATGFYRMTQRFYQPSAGRFTQLDPLPSSIVALNRYAYAGSNPSNFSDPAGLNHCSPAYGIAVGANLAASLVALAAATASAAFAPVIAPAALAAIAAAELWYMSAFAAVLDCQLY